MDQPIPNTPPVANVPPIGDNSANTIKPPVVGFTPPAPAGGSSGGMKFGFKKFNPKFAIIILVVLMGVIGLTAYITTTQKTSVKPKANQTEHNVCVNNSCDTAEGPGADQCSNPGGCCDGSTNCSNQRNTGCDVDSDCGTPNDPNIKNWCNRSNGTCQSCTRKPGTQDCLPPGESPPPEPARSALKVCTDNGGQETTTCSADANCGKQGGVCCTINNVNNCCYGDSSTGKDGNCQSGGSPTTVFCSGNTITNNTKDPVTVRVFTRAPGTACPSSIGAGSFTLGPGQSASPGECEQYDAACGRCNPTCPDDKSTPPKVSCTSVTTPNSANVTTTEKTKQFTVTVAGGKAPYQINWVSLTPQDQTLGSIEPGTFSPATCNITTANGSCTTTWTAPAGEPVANHHWTISASITDANNVAIKSQSTGTCAKSLTTTVSSNIACSGIAVSPNSATITSASETRTLTPTVTGTTNYTVTWAQTGGSTTPSSANPKVGVWTAPSSLPSSTTSWTVTATVAGAGQSANCTATFSYTPVNNYSYKTCENNACVSKDCNPRTTDCSSQSTCSNDNDCKQTYQYKTCENYACKTKDCNPKTIACASSNDCRSDDDCKTTTHKICRNEACVSVSGAGSDQCSSDVSCRTAAVPPPIPTSGITTPTVITIGTGVILTILGAILLL